MITALKIKHIEYFVLAIMLFGFTTCLPERDNPWDAFAVIEPEDWAPQNLAVSSSPIDLITLSWSNSNHSIEGYRIDRKIDQGVWIVKYASVKANENSYSDPSVEYNQHSDYSYRVYSFAGNNISTSDEISIGIPTITTSDVINITDNSATFKGLIVSDGGTPISSLGMVWSKIQNPTIENNQGITNEELTTGGFEAEINDLSPNTTYYARSYAANLIGIGYGESIRFTTISGSSGTGTFEDPYNVTSAVDNNSGNDVWVNGYLVGVMETSVDPFEASFEGPFATSTNIILAASPSETSIAKCIIVQLPIGEVRGAVNLFDNLGNLRKEIKLKGDLMEYFGSPGLRNTHGFWMDGDGINPDDEVTIGAFFEENFTTNLGSFNALSIYGDQIWEWASYDDGCVIISGFASPNYYANEDWLISPAIDLTGKVNVVMSIREAINYITSNGYDELQVLVSSNYDGTDAPTTAIWTELTGFNRPVGSDWSFVGSGDISMSAFEGETIHVAFKYKSTTNDSATWELSYVSLKEGNN